MFFSLALQNRFNSHYKSHKFVSVNDCMFKHITAKEILTKQKNPFRFVFLNAFFRIEKCECKKSAYVIKSNYFLAILLLFGCVCCVCVFFFLFICTNLLRKWENAIDLALCMRRDKERKRNWKKEKLSRWLQRELNISLTYVPAKQCAWCNDVLGFHQQPTHNA